MKKPCFFCDLQKDGEDEDRVIITNDNFIVRFDKFPISKGHCEIFPKEHIDSFFDLSDELLLSFFSLFKEAKEIISKKYNPNSYNIGINEGEVAGRSVPHLHVHLIPRYKGDVENPRGGIRNILSDKADYFEEIKNNPDYKDDIKYTE